MPRDFSNLTPEQRAIRSRNGRIGAHESWARTKNRAARTENARVAAFERFLKQVDPDGEMSYEDRLKAAENAQHAHMLRMSEARWGRAS